MKHSRSIAFVLAHLYAASALVACGGGDSSSATSSFERIAPLVGTAANLADSNIADSVVTDASHSLSAAQNLTASGDLFNTLVAGVASQSTSAAKPHLSAGALGQALAQTISQGASDQVLTAAQTETATCPGGGTLQISGQQASAGSLNQDDNFDVTATQCIMTFNSQTWQIHGQMRMRVAAGQNVNPTNLAAVTLNFEMTPLVLTMQGSGDQVGLDGGFQIRYDTQQTYRWSSLSSMPDLTLHELMNGEDVKGTLNNFFYDVHNGTMLGNATVNTNRKFSSPVQYRWSVLEALSFLPIDEIAAGTVLITSDAGGSQLRLRFGQPCTGSTSTNCVAYEKSSDGSTFEWVRLYTWSEFRLL